MWFLSLAPAASCCCQASSQVSGVRDGGARQGPGLCSLVRHGLGKGGRDESVVAFSRVALPYYISEQCRVPLVRLSVKWSPSRCRHRKHIPPLHPPSYVCGLGKVRLCREVGALKGHPGVPIKPGVCVSHVGTRLALILGQSLSCFPLVGRGLGRILI